LTPATRPSRIAAPDTNATIQPVDSETVDPQNPYLVHRLAIEQAIGIISSRARLSGPDAEDFASTVRLHVLKDDCAVLRKFSGRSSIRTFLVAVVEHCYQDWRNARWGKWRPSESAKRAGELGMRLERLLVRDRCTLDQAYETLRTNYGLKVSEAEVEALAKQLPVRSRRRFVSEEALDNYPSAGDAPDVQVTEREAAVDAINALGRLEDALKMLAPRDRHILSMRFWDGCSIVAIASTLQTDAKALYRHIDRLLLQLRNSLQATGLTLEAAREILINRGFQVSEGEPLSNDSGSGNTAISRARTGDDTARPGLS
jgi:RNA polymerase sigma factor (sigma-70 family)